jgi:hypothetical protein
MKQFYISVLCLALGGTAFAQAPHKHYDRSNISQVAPAHVSGSTGGQRQVLWSDDFSNPETWVTEITPGAPYTPWVIGTEPAAGPTAIAEIASTTAANGYALLDSDFYGSDQAIEVESSMLTTAMPVDLSEDQNVILEFQTFYRKWTYEECYVGIGTNNTDWPDLNVEYDAEEDPRVFRVFPGMDVQDPVDNPTTIRMNISEVAGGQSQVWVRFHWTGTWGYAWYVDDVQIVVQPEHDLIMDWGFISHVNNGIEYGRMPISELDGMIRVGGGFHNFGSATQTNVNVQINVENAGGTEVLAHTINIPSVAPGEEIILNEQIQVPEAMGVGLYRASFMVTSADEQPGAEYFDNNMVPDRTFEITSTVYSLDNIGNHPDGQEFLAGIGNTFANNESGMMVMGMYVVNDPIQITGLELVLVTGGTTPTTAGASLQIAIFDSSDVFVNFPENFTPNLANALALGQTAHTVTAADIAAGTIQIPFPANTILQAGNYFMSVEILGSATQRVRLLDDETVPQPWWASAIYLPNATTPTSTPNRIWSNGTAVGIRAMIAPNVSIRENDALTGVSVFPNPTNGLLNIRVDEAGTYDVEVMDLLGARIHSSRIVNNTVLDLSGKSQGVYLVRIFNEKGSHIERITLQ